MDEALKKTLLPGKRSNSKKNRLIAGAALRELSAEKFGPTGSNNATGDLTDYFNSKPIEHEEETAA